MRFGEKLKKIRKEHGLSQAELAAKAGLSTRTIQYYEKGVTYPNNREIYKRLAALLDTDADYLHNENDDFIAAAHALYGSTGKQQAKLLVEQAGALFAGGDMTDADKDEFMMALHNAYWQAKEANKTTYGRKHKDDTEETAG